MQVGVPHHCWGLGSVGPLLAWGVVVGWGGVACRGAVPGG